MRRPETFQKVRPLCVQLAKKFSVECLRKLRIQCQNCDQVCLQILQEYLIFPVRLALKTEESENNIIECVRFMNYIFSSTKLLSWNLFCDVMGQLFYYLFSPKDNSTTSFSEDLKLVVCQCAESMVNTSSNELYDKIYSDDFCLPLAQYVYTLLELTKNETYKTLRFAALSALAAFAYSSEKNADRSHFLRLKAADRLASFLPGISIALSNVICGDVKQGHAVIVLAIEIFRDFISLTVGDEPTTENDEEEVEGREIDRISRVTRNKVWISDVSGKLEILVRKIAEVVSHEHWKVRLNLVRCAETLLCTCSNNLPNCISPLLQLLFALNVDKYEEVIVASHSAVEAFSRHISHIKSFSSILEEDIFAISSKLIKIYLSANDVQKLTYLKVLQGYLQLLGKSVNNLLYSPPHLDRFLISFMNLVKFDYSDFNFLAEHFPTFNFEENLESMWPKRQFKYFHDLEISSRICAICHLLGLNGDIDLLIDYLLEKRAQHKNEALFLIISVVKSMNLDVFPVQRYFEEDAWELTTVDTDSAIHIISVILESLLSPDLWNITECSGDTPESHKENIVQVCLMLECVAVCSQVLQADFQPFLVDILCPVMEKAGCNNLIVSHTGKLALHCIAKSCGYNCITTLIIENSDYLVNSITAGLHQTLSRSETIVVLQVIAEHSTIDVLPLFQVPLYKMLKTLDFNQGLALPIMRVLKSVVVAIKKWFPVTEVAKNNNDDSMLGTDLKSQFLERHRLKRVEMSYLDNEASYEEAQRETTGGEEASLCNDSDKAEHKKTPLHVEIIMSVLDRCVHMMSSKHLELTVLTLEIIGNSILVLKSDIDKALPYVHKIWSPLMSRFSGDLIISMTAFETLIVIANQCGDFVKARTMKDVWPKFLSFLKSQSQISMSKGNSSDYQMTTGYKFQRLLLLELGNLAKKLDLTEKEFEMSILHCLPYLDCSQPDVLQLAATQSINSLGMIDSDAMWFYLSEFYGNEEVLKPPGPDFGDVHFVPQTFNPTRNYSAHV